MVSRMQMRFTRGNTLAARARRQASIDGADSLTEYRSRNTVLHRHLHGVENKRGMSAKAGGNLSSTASDYEIAAAHKFDEIANGGRCVGTGAGRDEFFDQPRPAMTPGDVELRQK